MIYYKFLLIEALFDWDFSTGIAKARPLFRDSNPDSQSRHCLRTNNFFFARTSEYLAKKSPLIEFSSYYGCCSYESKKHWD